ncbi:unnamed protein product [Rotaria sordida]|uniref:Uncharacterized protein n=2 Tax=Rotaria sordida TaxID=392033 RepID=A0A815RAM0_9BILA|nr:unnamed protein product [Rotaria sordida]CAF1201728.1 unnamed protein product [Rotaria sordida]CAF1228135.1 unnamed protein product [Rotaria sordida]CAF1474604.1 unnamed protein product [Rotaria sordida]CAF3852899.1 unnamed protein product [Rotaria sordida]
MMSKVTNSFPFAPIVMSITSAFSINAEVAINSARNLGPRLFAAFIYDWNEVFRVHEYYFWVLIIGSIVGAILGVWFYLGFIWIVKHYGHLRNIEDIDTNDAINN